MKAPIKEQRISTSIKLNKKNRDYAKAFFKEYNLTLSDGINIFLAKVVMDKKLPFEMEIPNKDLNKSIGQAKNGELIYCGDNLTDVMRELNS
ncbi:MAG: type II toxin-antitoxin system RelB/DinJ family antitoxin [Deltaproteobacteria bacterium]|jgi:DNA-damage-inducible protein J|nr:type II toxin-antitoxin system RelB/DinJ family antitoxin [Deltaproteobacteria bacterium]